MNIDDKFKYLNQEEINFLTRIFDKIQKIENGKKANALTKFDLKLITENITDAFMTLLYAKLKEGLIYEKENLYIDLLYFLNKEDYIKFNYIAWMLNHYYNGYLEKQFELTIVNEEYEISAILNKVRNISVRPEIY